jgi:hypothetical protein
MMKGSKIGRNDSLPASLRNRALQILPFLCVFRSSLYIPILTIFKQILHNSLQMLTEENELLPSFHNVLCKTCLAATQLVNPTVVNGWQSSSAVRICEILCNIFILLGNSGDELKSECYICYNLMTQLMVQKQGIF